MTKFYGSNAITKLLELLHSKFNTKVDKITGKGLSTEDYTTDEKSKLSSISPNANNYELPTATTTTIGGVKVDGSTINISNGTISGNHSNLLPLDGSRSMTNQLVIGTTSTTTFTGVSTIRKTTSKGVRKAGFFVNTDGTSKFLNADSSKDLASLVFDNTSLTYIIGQYDTGKKNTVYHSGNLSGATTSTEGLMSSLDKTKLDGIATGANNYTLPTASESILGGVKVDGSTITISDGVISSTPPGEVSGNAGTATKLQSSRTVTLSGDVTGSFEFDGSSNITVNTTVGDDSHNHVIGNIDGLQTALDAKVDTTSLSSVATSGSYNDLTNKPTSYTLPTASTTTLGGVKVDGSTVKITNGVISSPAQTTITGNAGSATKLQTARAITLSGDVTGTANFDGSAAASITTVVADDSHNHTYVKKSSLTDGNYVDSVQAVGSDGNRVGTIRITNDTGSHSMLLGVHDESNNAPSGLVITNTAGTVTGNLVGSLTASKFIGPLNGVADTSKQLFYVIPTGGTSAYTATVTGITSLEKGLMICVKFPNAPVSNATLNINSLGAKTLKYRNTVGGAYFTSSAHYIFVYDGTYFQAIHSYDSNNYDRIAYNVATLAQSAIVAGNICVNNGSGYFHLKTGAVFDITNPILYANGAVAANATETNFYIQYNINLSTTQTLTLTLYKPVFIKGKLVGTKFTPVSTTPLTQTIPTSKDGYQYILLGIAYSATNIRFLSEHPIYQFTDKFELYSTPVSKTTVSATIGTTWSGTSTPYTQSITVTGALSTSVVEVSISPAATKEQVEAYQSLNWSDGGQTTNSITIKAWGIKNTIDIPVVISYSNGANSTPSPATEYALTTYVDTAISNNNTTLNAQIGNRADKTLSNLGSLTTVSSNLNTLGIRVVVETYSDSSGNWYRIYNDKWCEQGGTYSWSGAWTTKTLNKPFANTNYCFVGTGARTDNSPYQGFLCARDYTTTSVNIWFSDDTTPNPSAIRWYACGYTS